MASVEQSDASAGGRRARGGAGARRALRSHPKLQQLPFITRKIPLTTVLDEAGLELIERNAQPQQQAGGQQQNFGHHRSSLGGGPRRHWTLAGRRPCGIPVASAARLSR